MSIPTLSQTLNTEFTNTWFEVRPEAIDNILDATVITALLKEKGCFKTQVGSTKIERTVRYGKKTAFTFKGKADTLPVTEEELTTVALWPWAYMGVPVTRTFADDQTNAGKFQIVDYVTKRLNAAREALIEKLENIFGASTMLNAGTRDTTEPYGLIDYLPYNASTSYFDGTTTADYLWGGINRNNTWWEHEDFTAAAGTAHQHTIKAGPLSLTLIDDMKNVFNTTGKQRSSPDIILTGQEVFEDYENFALAKDQIIKEADTRLADLGYEILRFKGKPITWTDKLSYTTTSRYEMLMINSQYLDVVYDPTAWFEMTSWERPARQLEQVAYILSAMQLVGYNPRFNSRTAWTAR